MTSASGVILVAEPSQMVVVREVDRQVVVVKEGMTGSAGIPGQPGTTWREGSGAPLDSLGLDGDLYLDVATGDVYERQASTYAVVGNLTGPAGAPGPPGSPGPPGAPGSGGDLTYLHTQGVAALTWNVVHGLNKYPTVSITDSAHTEVEAQIAHISANAFIVTLSYAISGYAFCN